MDFWQEINQQLMEISEAKTVADVITALGGKDETAFFAGSGGDNQVIEYLLASNGWKIVWVEADYHFIAKDSEGSYLNYVEGDVYRISAKQAKDWIAKH